MCFFSKLFKKKPPEYRVLKETRAVKESADGQELTLQSFYIPQIKEGREDWKPIKVDIARPRGVDDGDWVHIFRDYYHDDRLSFETEEEAKDALECAVFSEEYRGLTIKKVQFKDFGRNKKHKVVYYISEEDTEYGFDIRTYKTYNEIKEAINAKKPQVVNIETITLL